MNSEIRAIPVPRMGVQFAGHPRTRKQGMSRNGQTTERLELAGSRRLFRVTRKRSVCGFHTLFKSVNPRTRGTQGAMACGIGGDGHWRGAAGQRLRSRVGRRSKLPASINAGMGLLDGALLAIPGAHTGFDAGVGVVLIRTLATDTRKPLKGQGRGKKPALAPGTVCPSQIFTNDDFQSFQGDKAMRPTKPKPPEHLSQAMKDFWKKLTTEYSFSEEHVWLLRLTCEAFDRSQEARKQIATDGMIVSGKQHPLIGVEAKSTELFMRGLRDLQLEREVAGAQKA